MKEIYCMRHLATEYTQTPCFCGWTDCPILETETIDFANPVLAGLQAEMAVYLSSLQRCTQTFALLNQGVGFSNVTVCDQLKERNYGIYNGMHKSAVSADASGTFRTSDSIRPPNGESRLDVRARVQPFLAQIMATDCRKILIVSHQGVLREIYRYFGVAAFQKFTCGEIRRIVV